MDSLTNSLLGILSTAVLTAIGALWVRHRNHVAQDRQRVTNALLDYHAAAWTLWVHTLSTARPSSITTKYVLLLQHELTAEAHLRRRSGPDKRARRHAARALRDVTNRLIQATSAWDAEPRGAAREEVRALLTLATAISPRWVRDPASFSGFNVEDELCRTRRPSAVSRPSWRRGLQARETTTSTACDHTRRSSSSSPR